MKKLKSLSNVRYCAQHIVGPQKMPAELDCVPGEQGKIPVVAKGVCSQSHAVDAHRLHPECQLQAVGRGSEGAV